MIRFDVTDLVIVTAAVLDLDTAAALDLLDLEAADRALADPAPPTDDDPAGRAGALLYGLLHHRPLPRGNRRVALIAAAQFLAVNGWQLDVEAPDDLVRVLRTADGPAVLAEWIRQRTHRAGTRPKERSMFTRSTGNAQPFTRFTERARRVVVLAQEEARMHDHNRIGTEHILLGLIHEGQGVAAKALQSLGINLDDVRRLVEEMVGCGRQAPSGHLPLSLRGKAALDLSLREALRFRQTSVATEHILLGLIREGEGVAAQVLVRLGVSLDEVRERVLHLTEAEKRPTDPGEEVTRLRQEVDRLRALLHDAGIDPEAGRRSA